MKLIIFNTTETAKIYFFSIFSTNQVLSLCQCKPTLTRSLPLTFLYLTFLAHTQSMCSEIAKHITYIRCNLNWVKCHRSTTPANHFRNICLLKKKIWFIPSSTFDCHVNEASALCMYIFCGFRMCASVIIK